VKGLRAAWPEQVAGVRAEDFVFLDESGLNRAMTRTCARSRVNTRAFASAPRNWGDNVSILGALCLRGALEPMCVNGATDGRVFLTYLKEVLIPQLWKGAGVVMDNLGAHKLKGVREQIEAAGARLLYLPPCWPDFNPIEMAWSKLKNFLRKVAARTTEALDRAIGQGLHAVSASDARSFFKHCGYIG
jgi:transposase